MIHVIDYKVGNIGSVVNMLNYLGAKVVVANRPEDIEKANKLILPGVGAFDTGASALKNTGFNEAILEAVQGRNATVLGICLGMQLLMEYSEEGDCPGLGLFAGGVKKIPVNNESMRIPHMGWNTVEIVKANSLINSCGDAPHRFYFVHSYFVDCLDSQEVIGLTSYGSKFASMIEKDNVLGVQFHPEKSHRFGKELFRNFLAA
jgi:glutamine amidotransferase